MTTTIALKGSHVLCDDASYDGTGKLMSGDSYLANQTDQTTTLVADVADLPADFVWGKYLWQSDTYVVEAGFVDMSAIPDVVDEDVAAVPLSGFFDKLFTRQRN